MGMSDHRRRRQEPNKTASAIKRRDLLTAAGIATAAAGLPAEALAEDEATRDEAVGDPTRLTYHETEHIRWFYARARM